MKDISEISLRPYPGRLFYAKTKESYEKFHRILFTESDPLHPSMEGRFVTGSDKDGKLVYIIWSTDEATLAHEISHVILHLFERIGIDPRQANGEPFCYMLSQLMKDIKEQNK